MKYLVAVLSIAIFIILSFVYIEISKPNSYETKKIMKQKEMKFSKPFNIKKPEFSYFFPVRVLYMKIDFNKFRYILIYKISLKSIDRFAFFNIRVLLNNYNIHYSLLERKKAEIYIFFRSLKEANTILNLFKEYNFNIKIKKIKKRI